MSTWVSVPVRKESPRATPIAQVATRGDQRKRAKTAVEAMLTAEVRGLTFGSVMSPLTSTAIMMQMIARMT